MAFRATLEPMLIKARSAEIMRETATAGSGMLQSGDTLESHLWPGRPASRENDQIWREAAATSETAQADSNHNDDGGHGTGGGVGSGGVEKDLDEGIECGRRSD